jgi:seryl-tRNA synthetase
MLDPNYVASHLEEVRRALLRRSAAAAAALDGVAECAERRRELIQKTETQQAARNAANQEMAELAKSGDQQAFEVQRAVLKALSTEVKQLETQLAEVEGELRKLLLGVPNMPHSSCPEGQDESGNLPVRSWGEKPQFSFAPKQHFEVGERLGILDFERAAKLSGARFAVLRGLGAKLERALGQYMLDLHIEQHGYEEVRTPYLVKASALEGTGQLPKFGEAGLFKTARRAAADEQDVDTSALYLIPTAEVPVTNLHADEILPAEKLPVAYVAHTPCFRSEAGSYGKDVRGLIRQHQFDKVELVRFVKPEESFEQLEVLTRHAEAVLQGLGLHYRVVELCAGDMSACAQKGYDLEVWLPGQGAYREISSCSNFGDYQARRAKIRYRPEAKAKPRLLHTLNGSGLAVGRTLVALLEQYQRQDGSVAIPEALRPFMGVDVLKPS